MTEQEKLQHLKHLAATYGGDKASHGYLEHYAKWLPDSCRSFLEIGVAQGASLLMWDKFWGQDCDIHCIDLFKDPNHITPRWCRRKFIVPHVGDQTDLEFLSSIKTQFQVIVEDASHNSHAQLISFKHHFINNLDSGGVYCVEDLHCCKEEFYWGGEVKRYEDTMLHMLNVLLETGDIENVYFSKDEARVFESLITDVQVCNDKLAFIWKK